MFASIDNLASGLRERSYIATREVATQAFLASRLGRPLLIEGEHGCGKSALAEALAEASAAPVFRVRCHEGMSLDETLYEWDVAGQLIRLREGEQRGQSRRAIEGDVFSRKYLIPGPVMAAMQHEGPEPAVLVFEDVNRAPQAYQVWLNGKLPLTKLEIAHLGAVRAVVPPTTLLVSSGPGLDEALKRRCLYLWLGHPAFETEVEILVSSVPGLPRALAGEVANFVAKLRRQSLVGVPGVAESKDWANALVALRANRLEPELIDQTLGCLLKHPQDLAAFRERRMATLVQPSVDRSG